jgi:hypothetical protein
MLALTKNGLQLLINESTFLLAECEHGLSLLMNDSRFMSVMTEVELSGSDTEQEQNGENYLVWSSTTFVLQQIPVLVG